MIARTKYLKGVREALEQEILGGRAMTDALSEVMRRDRAEMDAARAKADAAEKAFEASRQRLLDTYSHIGVIHAKLGIIDAQLADIEPTAVKLEDSLSRHRAAKDLGRSMAGEPDKAAHLAAVAIYEAMDPGTRPSLSALQHQVRKAVHGFSIVTPNPEDGE